jgi:hypothetical protein
MLATPEAALLSRRSEEAMIKKMTWITRGVLTVTVIIALWNYVSAWQCAVGIKKATQGGDSQAAFIAPCPQIPRHLLTSVAQADLFWLVWTPACFKAGPDVVKVLGQPASYLYVVGATSCLALVVWFIARRKYATALALVITPIFRAFSSGYDELYPFICAVPIVFVSRMVDKEIKSEWELPLWAAFMPLIYTGFAPLSVVAVVWALVLRPTFRQVVLCIVVPMVVVPVVIHLLWTGTSATFIESYLLYLNLGEMNTLYVPYQGHSAGPRSILFAWDYLFTSEHVKDYAHMMAWGMWGWMSVVALAAWIYHVYIRSVTRETVVLAVCIILYAGLAFVTIPKLGPDRDKDMFFEVALLVSYSVGWIIDGVVMWRNSARSANL